MQSTLKVGDVITCRIEDIAFGGDGVGREQGMAVFIPFVIDGERVRAEMTEVRARYGRARLIEVLEPSPDRVTPPCPYYGVCPGCQYQHIAYERQRSIKHKQVEELFRRIGGMPSVEVKPVTHPSSPYGYRNRITLHGPGRPAYKGQSIGERVEIDACLLAQDAVNAALNEWKGTHPEGIAGDADLVIRSDGDGGARVFTGRPADHVPFRVGDRAYSVPLGAFTQISEQGATALVNAVLDEAAGTDTFIDAYCGVGIFALPMAEKAATVWGIESDGVAVRAAEDQARREGLNNVRFLHATVEKGLRRALACTSPRKTVCLLDPPRSGCSPEVLSTLLKFQPRCILYISCAPDRLARDARSLVAAGYRLVHLRPFDLFPQTAHLEVLATLVKDNP